MRGCWWVFSFVKMTVSIRFDTYTLFTILPWVQHTSFSAAPPSLNHSGRILKVALQMSHMHQTYQHTFIISSIYGVICCHFCICPESGGLHFAALQNLVTYLYTQTCIHIGLKACYFDRFYMLKYFQKIYGHFNILFSTSVALIKSDHNLFSKIII